MAGRQRGSGDNSRLVGFDGVRAVAALCVLGYHDKYSVARLEQPVPEIVVLGRTE
jgi:peptidoglycan/LPS O-acetylase OafA/YrhL